MLVFASVNLTIARTSGKRLEIHIAFQTLKNKTNKAQHKETRGLRARAYARAFPRSQKIVFADAPHPCYLKAPSYFNRLLLQFAGASGSAGSVEEGAPAPSEVRVVAQWTPPMAAEAAAEL